MLPDVDGFQICKKIREKFWYPVIMLTAKGTVVDKIMGLTIGADDYITKPFNPLEVAARVKTQLRRYRLYNHSATKQGEPARGRFADGMVALFQTALGIKYDAALQLYERIFRSHMDAMILFSILLTFAVLFCLYLRWLTRYFEAVSEGMDILFAGAPGAISLPPELFSIEKKMNLAKHMMLLQKSDMLVAEQRHFESMTEFVILH